MAKVSLNPIERKLNRLYEHIEYEIHKCDFSQTEVGKWLGISRQMVGYKLRTKTLSIPELFILMNRLAWTDEEVIDYLGMEYR